MKRLRIVYCCVWLFAFWGNGVAQNENEECFAAWTFDVAQDWMYYYGMTFAADWSYFPTATLYANGSYGSSQFATYTSDGYFTQMIKTDWVGTTLGDPRSEPFDGYCLGFKHPSSARRSFVIACPTTLYSNLKLRFAATRSNTGFKKMSFAWSLTGQANSFQNISSKPCDALSFQVFEMNMSTFPQLENQPMIYLRVTIDSIGSSAYQGNIKFDNICLIGDKCTETLTLYDSIYSGDPYTRYGFDFESVEGDGDYVFQRRVHFDYACDSLYVLNLHITDTTTVIPVDTTGNSTTDTTGNNPTDTAANFISEMNFDNLVSVYPNPFSDILYVEPAEEQFFRRIIVCNSIGMKMEDEVLSVGSSGISNGIFLTNDWKPGIYFVHCFLTNGISVVKKLVKW